MRVGRAVKVVLAAGLVVTGLALGGGVGGVATHRTTAASIHAAVVSSEGASSMSADISVTAVSGGTTVDIAGHGVFGGRLARLVLDVPGEGTIEERVTADGYYMSLGALPGASAALPDGKKWLFVSYDAMARQTGVDVRALQDRADQNDPRRSLENLEAAAGPVTALGTDVVNGAPATHYRVMVDYAKYAHDKLAGARPEVRDEIAALGTRPADVWIDGSDRVVEWSQDLDVTQDGRTIHEVVTVTITGFDVPLVVEAPPAGEVFDIGAAEAAHTTV